jgi:large subunit ribosomal protein L47
MEFFDAKLNWGQNDVPHGRHWKLDELRIKSNTDLHKLWYILLKEKNMLLTMEHHAKVEHRLFPSAERLDKVEMSMKNLEDVVRERNRAYYELETGETGERPGKMATNAIGVNFYYRMVQHVIPSGFNVRWHKKLQHGGRGFAVHKFQKLLRERIWNEKRKAKNRDRNEVCHQLKRNPNIDINILQTKYPEVNIERLMKHDKFKGHYVPKLE